MDNREKKGLENAKDWTEAEIKIAEKLLSSNDGLAKDVVEQSKHNARRWFVAWLITLAVLAATNAAWIYVFQSYDYVSQSSDGVNNINSGTQGDITNEPESEN